MRGWLLLKDLYDFELIRDTRGSYSYSSISVCLTTRQPSLNPYQLLSINFGQHSTRTRLGPLNLDLHNCVSSTGRKSFVVAKPVSQC